MCTIRIVGQTSGWKGHCVVGSGRMDDVRTFGYPEDLCNIKSTANVLAGSAHWCLKGALVA